MLLGIIFLLTVCLLSARLRRRIELVLPATVLALMVLLTALAMCGALLLITPIMVGLFAFLCLWTLADLLRKRLGARAMLMDLRTYALTPGLLLFGGLAVFFWYTAWPMTVWWRDDLAQWALSVKSLWHAGGLVDGAHLLNERFGDYPPGVQVLQWLWMHAGGAWSEQALYGALFGTYAAFLMPLASRIPWRRWYLLPLVWIGFVAMPTWGNVLSSVFLGVDTTLSLCFGYVLVLVWQHRRGDGWSLLAIALGLCGLFLIKAIGLLLGTFALTLLLVRGQEKPGRVVLAALAPLLTVAVWSLYCTRMGLSGYNSTGVTDRLSAMLAGSYVPPVNAAGVLPALLQALTSKYAGELTMQTAPPLSIPLAAWLALLLGAVLLLALGKLQPRREMRRLAVFLCGMFVIFTAAIYASFFTTFYDETNVYTGAYAGNMVLLIERYMAPMMLGSAMLLLWLWIQGCARAPSALKRPLPLIATIALTAVVALGTNWALMRNVLDPQLYFQGEHSVGSEAAVRDQETWGSDLEEIADARVLIDLTSASDYTKEIIYSFAPAKFFLSTPENTASPQALAEFLLTQNITHVACMDESSPLAQAATPLADEYGFYGYTLYAVVPDGDQVVLTEY